MPRRVICISRTHGAGGEEVGRLVAERLGLRYVDEEIVVRAAEKGGVDPGTAADAERRRSFLQRLLDEIAAGAAVEGYAWTGFIPSLAEEGVHGDDLRALIREAIEEAAGEGDVVIVAHAASYALAGYERVLRVLVTGSPEARARRLAAEGDAEKAVRDSDRARADYLKRFYGVDAELPSHYDVVVNTDRLSAVDAAAVVVSAAAS